MKRKKVDKHITLKTKTWTFDSNFAKKFDDHINKSVPCYQDFRWLCLEVSDYFVKENSLTYDIGCSTGSFLNLLNKRHCHKNKIKFIGIDIVQDMIKFANKNYKNKNISFIKKDLKKYNFKKCNFVTSFFTMQFIDQSDRQKVLDKVFKSLNWGGALYFAEKIRSSDARNQEMINEIYKNWKIKKGFKIEEVNAKTESLKGVLDPFTYKGNYNMLKRAGFDEIHVLAKYLNFQIILAIK